MVLAVPKAFILNSLHVSKLPDSLFTINSFTIDVISINVKNTKKFQKYLKHLLPIATDLGGDLSHLMECGCA